MSDEPIPPKRLPSKAPGQHPLTLLVVPTKEERHNIDWVMERFQDLDDPDLHILIADDDSHDKTWSRAGTWAADDARMHLLRRPGRYKGRGYALREAYKWALDSEHGYEYLVECAANRTDDIARVPRLIAALDAGADLVLGARSVAPGAEDHAIRQKHGLARLATGAAALDVESGFRAWRLSALKRIGSKLKARDHRLKAEAVAAAVRAGLAIAEVPVPFIPYSGNDRKRGGKSSVMSLCGLWVRRLTGGV